MTPFDFSGQKVLVTGGSRGIGQAISELLLRHGAQVTVTGTGAAAGWCGQYPQCRYRRVDFLCPDAFEAFVRDISAERWDVLINNAGRHIPSGIDQMDQASWDEVLRINLEAPMKLIQAVSVGMMEARRGRILNITSTASVVSRPTSAAYSASKSGLLGLTRSCALRLAPYNILVNALAPGPVQTDMVQNVLTESQRQDLRKGIPLNRFGRPEEIANWALFLCGPWNTYMTGANIIVDGGMTIQ